MSLIFNTWLFACFVVMATAGGFLLVPARA